MIQKQPYPRELQSEPKVFSNNASRLQAVGHNGITESSSENPVSDFKESRRA
jgi:hypothetical protein